MDGSVVGIEALVVETHAAVVPAEVVRVRAKVGVGVVQGLVRVRDVGVFELCALVRAAGRAREVGAARDLALARLVRVHRRRAIRRRRGGWRRRRRRGAGVAKGRVATAGRPRPRTRARRRTVRGRRRRGPPATGGYSGVIFRRRRTVVLGRARSFGHPHPLPVEEAKAGDARDETEKARDLHRRSDSGGHAVCRVPVRPALASD
mmetsp:Transcript_5119/g.17420  ORF Transcript_5119/g.17420 Transcript_5119/m.17420 type:complete len:205 (-) Transcript_5119:206-820(-)